MSEALRRCGKSLLRTPLSLVFFTGSSGRTESISDPSASITTMILNRGDRRRAEMLYRECTQAEHGDTWYPFFSKCTTCRGYVFGAASDVQRQLGACGCLIALEAEMASVRPREIVR